MFSLISKRFKKSAAQVGPDVATQSDANSPSPTHYNVSQPAEPTQRDQKRWTVEARMAKLHKKIEAEEDVAAGDLDIRSWLDADWNYRRHEVMEEFSKRVEREREIKNKTHSVSAPQPS